jgi:hypothetical protein
MKHYNFFNYKIYFFSPRIDDFASATISHIIGVAEMVDAKRKRQNLSNLQAEINLLRDLANNLETIEKQSNGLI